MGSESAKNVASSVGDSAPIGAVYRCFQIEGNASGTIEPCDPPNGFDATWEYGGDVSWIELRLEGETSGAARFTLEHIAHVDDERALQLGPGAVGVGWDLSLIGLSLHLDGDGAAVDSAAVHAWLASGEGRAFIGAASDAWGAASVAFGTDPEAARAAAGRTTAFYTGAPVEGP